LLQHQSYVEKLHGSALGLGDIGGDDGCDHHVALVVESDGEGGPRRPVRHGDSIRPAAAFHPADADRLPLAQSVKLAAEQFEIAHAVKLRVVRHSRRAIAESELGAQVKLDLRAAVGGAAAERTASAPLLP